MDSFLKWPLCYRTWIPDGKKEKVMWLETWSSINGVNLISLEVRGPSHVGINATILLSPSRPMCSIESGALVYNARDN